MDYLEAFFQALFIVVDQVNMYSQGLYLTTDGGRGGTVEALFL